LQPPRREDEEHDEDERERGSGADPGRGVDVGPAALRFIATMLIAMPAQSVDPRIDEGREQPAVEHDTQDGTREEGHDELDLPHRAVVEG
jgi:hypothetical protein